MRELPNMSPAEGVLLENARLAGRMIEAYADLCRRERETREATLKIAEGLQLERDRSFLRFSLKHLDDPRYAKVPEAFAELRENVVYEIVHGVAHLYAPAGTASLDLDTAPHLEAAKQDGYLFSPEKLAIDLMREYREKGEDRGLRSAALALARHLYEDDSSSTRSFKNGDVALKLRMDYVKWKFEHRGFIEYEYTDQRTLAEITSALRALLCKSFPGCTLTRPGGPWGNEYEPQHRESFASHNGRDIVTIKPSQHYFEFRFSREAWESLHAFIREHGGEEPEGAEDDPDYVPADALTF